jgi:hypothetical protein
MSNVIPGPVLAAALTALLFAPADGWGQAVTGQVVDAVTGEPVAHASVRPVDPTGREHPAVSTDSAGVFRITLEAAQYAFLVQHIAYETLHSPPVMLRPGERVTVEIRMGPRPVEMEPLVVRGRRRDGEWPSAFQRRMEQRGRTGLGRFISREDIERESALTVNDLLARQPGLRVMRVDLADVIVMTGRGRQCLPALYFDGVPVAQGLTAIDLSAWFQPDDIEGIEIYAAANTAPAELRTHGCGVIGIWSRAHDRDAPPLTLRRVLTAAGIALGILLLRIL